jgi:Chaperone of endosialidase
MKINRIIPLVFLPLTFSAQIKLSQLGNIALGSSLDPATSAKLQIIGNYTTFTSTNSIPTSAAYIRSANSFSNAVTPDYTWYNDDVTGIFHPGSGMIGVSISGQEKIRIQNNITFFPSNGNSAINSAPLIRNSNSYSVAALPDFTWWGNDVTGIFHPSLNTIGLSTNGIERMRIDGNGDAGIGATPTSAYKLKVAGAITATSFPVSSDARFKKNINQLEKPLDKILRLNGLTYEFKNDEFKNRGFSEGLNIGFLAQEVQNVLPALVKIDNDGYYSINYDGIIPVLVEAIKEQQIQINELKKNIVNTNSEKVISKTVNISEIKNQNSLQQNIPNPFSKNTTIKYAISSDSKKALIYLFDMQGALIKTFEDLKNGSGELIINGGELKAGMYLYSLVVDEKEIDTKRMILTK